MAFSLFRDTILIARILRSEAPFGGTFGTYKNQLHVDLNTFFTTRPILGLKLSLY